MAEKTVSAKVDVRKETARAWSVVILTTDIFGQECYGEAFWLPKSIGEIENGKAIFPKWFARKNDILCVN